MVPGGETGHRGCPRWLRGSPRALALRRRARFKRSNSVTAGVQADLELEGFTGLAVATEDKALQFGRPFQRHSSEPESGRQYAVYKTVHTQGQWAYREDYQLQYDTVEVPRRDAWMERGSRSLPDSGRASPCHRDGEWFIKLLQAEVEKMEGWCQQMEREAEDYDLPEESESGRSAGLGGTGGPVELGGGGGHSHGPAVLPPWSISPAKFKEVGWGQETPGNPLGQVGSGDATRFGGHPSCPGCPADPKGMQVPLVQGRGSVPHGRADCLLSPTSPGEDPERRGQRPAPHVPEGAAVLPPLPAEHGECQGQPWRVGGLVSIASGKGTL